VSNENIEEVHEIIENISSFYLVQMKERLDLLSAQQMLDGWANSYYRNESLIEIVIQQLNCLEEEGKLDFEGSRIQIITVL